MRTGFAARTGALALVLGLAVASPALAVVHDLGSGAATGEVQAIQDGLNAVSAEDFEVLLMPATPPDGLDAEAERQFAVRGLGPRQALFVVDWTRKAIGVKLGESFVEQGVAGATLTNRVEVAFARYAAEGRPGEGAVELARQLKVLRATGSSAPFRMPWELLALLALAGLGGGAYALARRKHSRLSGLRERLGGVRLDAGRAAPALQALKASLDGRGRAGASAVLAARLLKLGEAAVAEAQAVLEAVRVAEAALGEGRELEAERSTVTLDQRAFLAEAALAAARSAAELLALDRPALARQVEALAAQAEPTQEALLAEARRAAEAADPAACLAALARAAALRPAGPPVRSPADLVAEAEAAARDWQALRSAQAHLATQGEVTAVSAQVLHTRLREARALLTAVPVRLDEGEALLGQLASQLASGGTPVRVQRVPAPDPTAELLWDMAPARYLVVAGGTGALVPAPRGERGRTGT